MTGECRRRALVLNHFAVPRASAGGTRHVELFSRLRNWDFTLIVADRHYITRRRSKAKHPHFVSVPTLPYRGAGISRLLNWISYAASSVIAGLMVGRHDVVYGSSPHLFAGLAGRVLAGLRRVPFVLEVRDLWPEVLVAMKRLDPGSPIFAALRRLEHYLYRRADAIVVLAEGSVGAIASLGIPRRKIVFIPNGADPDDFVSQIDRQQLRERYGMQGLAFVYAGAHGPANGLDLLLDAAKELGAKRQGIQVFLVGDGPTKAHLMDRVRRERIPNVRFLDPIPKAEMPDLLAAADVGLHVLADVPLFQYGVSPNKLFDYMAAGLPVVTNCPGEVARIVETAGAGIPATPYGLESAILAMADATADQRRIWGKGGRSYIEETHSRDLLAKKLEDLLDTLVGGNPGSSSS